MCFPFFFSNRTGCCLFYLHTLSAVATNMLFFCVLLNLLNQDVRFSSIWCLERIYIQQCCFLMAALLAIIMEQNNKFIINSYCWLNPLLLYSRASCKSTLQPVILPNEFCYSRIYQASEVYLKKGLLTVITWHWTMKRNLPHPTNDFFVHFFFSSDV